jgi:hypothetical protein
VNVIRHEDIRVDRDPVPDRGIVNLPPERPVVGVTDENRSSIVPALDDVQRDIGYEVARQAGHFGCEHRMTRRPATSSEGLKVWARPARKHADIDRKSSGRRRKLESDPKKSGRASMRGLG